MRECDAAIRSEGQPPSSAPVPAARVSLTISPSEISLKFMKEIIFLVEEAPEGGFTARALGHAIFTEADTIKELKSQIRDAVRCHFGDETSPPVIRLHQVKEEVIPA